jgi:hypothetical protein
MARMQTLLFNFVFYTRENKPDDGLSKLRPVPV